MAQQTGRPQGVTPDGPKIRRLRRELGLTAAQLGAEVGRHPKSIMRAEAVNQPISQVLAGRIARVLSVKVEDILVSDSEDEQEPAA